MQDAGGKKFNYLPDNDGKLEAELNRAIFAGDGQKVISLLDQNVNPYSGIRAASGDIQHLPMLKLMLENGEKYGVNPNDAIITAIHRNVLPALELLLQHGANASAGIFDAAKGHRIEHFNLLINYGANYDKAIPSIFERKDLSVLKFLIANGVTRAQVLKHLDKDKSKNISSEMKQFIIDDLKIPQYLHYEYFNNSGLIGTWVPESLLSKPTLSYIAYLLEAKPLEVTSPEYKKLTSITYLVPFEYGDDAKSPYLEMAKKSPLVEKLLDHTEKEDVVYRIDIMNINNDSGGVYKWSKEIQVDHLKLQPFIIHELSHGIMQHMFGNLCNPYPAQATDQKTIYQHAFYQTYANVHKLLKPGQQYGSNEGLLEAVKTASLDKVSGSKYMIAEILQSMLKSDSYTPADFDCELVVRYPQLLITDGVNQEDVEEIMQPIAQYYKDYIIPRLDAALEPAIAAEEQHSESPLAWAWEQITDYASSWL
jgi:hypothetical protein